MRFMRCNPFDSSRALDHLQGEINRLFDVSVNPSAIKDVYAPSVDIYEDNGNLYVEADLPGFEQKDISINFKNGNLSISAEKKEIKEEKKKNYYRNERSKIKFYRVIELPSTIDASKVKANYKSGVLKITLPKKEEAKEKEIKIDVE
ncbi:MAG: Hsp20/alpha crystallin family protein [Candidatus Omnitrophota bacterium]|nr:MAG: Hsp20/alpha crystallin family protein [Candidatus Omnitrophota bacterium]